MAVVERICTDKNKIYIAYIYCTLWGRNLLLTRNLLFLGWYQKYDRKVCKEKKKRGQCQHLSAKKLLHQKQHIRSANDTFPQGIMLIPRNQNKRGDKAGGNSLSYCFKVFSVTFSVQPCLALSQTSDLPSFP